MDEIKSPELNVMSWSDYSYYAYNNTEEINMIGTKWVSFILPILPHS